jgi:hypothetical protein
MYTLMGCDVAEKGGKDMKGHSDRRTALKYLLAFLASVIGSPSFAKAQQKLPDSPQSEVASPPAVSGHGKTEAGVAIEPQEPATSVPTPKSTFKLIYSDKILKDSFYLFLKNVYHLYPENQFHQLISDVTLEYNTDQDIYLKLQERLPKIKPALSSLTYALPALRKQKEEMARQTAELLGSFPSVKGYVEIGTTGRYVKGIKERLPIDGTIYLVNDQAATYSPEDIVERGRIPKVGTYVPMGNYEPFDGTHIPTDSVELVTNFIGFHHAPPDKRDGFIQSVWRVLKPGGRLVVRDHDVDSPAMDTFVALAHDVFNAGLGIPWEQNQTQIRNFTSVTQLQEYLGKVGFERSSMRLLQDGDPTRNTLLLFVKPVA